MLAAAVTYACGGGGSDAPTQPAVPLDRTPIRVIGGAGQTDTVGVVLPQPLVVEIHDTTGKALVGATVNFTSIDGPDSLLVSPVNPQNFWSVATDVTDAQGRIKALVKTGVAAGTARVVVAVPTLGAADTITYTVKPGAPAKFTLSPRDTMIQPGTSFTLKALPTDRLSNPISSAVPTFSATGVTVTSAGLVSATNTTARARVVVSYQGVSDSASVSVIPKFPMVINRNKSVVLINSDGTGATTLATSTSFSPSVSPSSVAATPSVVFNQGNPCCDGRLWVVQPGGTPRLLLSATTLPEGWARLSPDGTWVYFVRDWRSLWRVHLDGTGLDSLTAFSAIGGSDPAPTISPDGGSVAVAENNGIRIIDVATKTSRVVPVACGSARYSPDGAFFACLDALGLSVVQTDGTGQRHVADLFNASPDQPSGLDWTPDGKWVLMSTVYMGAILVEVSSGTVVPLTALGTDLTQVREASFVR